mmetsp:Transcript_33984/g.40688  ORF Transcript_33984/g.40688 Transcript_33984/m.40688 type:complete len:113 (+) Transcript_33984:422-760(+)
MQRPPTTSSECILTDLLSFVRGIFQGGSLSLVIFSLTLIHLTNLLKRKMSVITSKRKNIKSTLHRLTCVTEMPLLTNEDSYEYLGILQTDTILHDKVKEKSKNEYFKRGEKI